MQYNALQATHVNDLKSLQEHIKKINSSLSGLSHIVGGEIHQLGSSLTLTPGIHNNRYLPKPARTTVSSSTVNLLNNLFSSLGKTSSSSSYTISYKQSSGQMWAQIASSILKAQLRNL